MDVDGSRPPEPEEGNDVSYPAHGCEWEAPVFVREGCGVGGPLEAEKVIVPEDHGETSDGGADAHWDECQPCDARGETVDAWGTVS